MVACLRIAQQAELELRSTGVVITQVWRDPLDGRRTLLVSSSQSTSQPSMTAS